MIRALLVAATLAGPLAADPMTDADCAASWRMFADWVARNQRGPAFLADKVRSDLMAARLRTTPEGWCRVRGDDPALDDTLMTTVDWQFDGADLTQADGGVPTGLRVRAREVLIRPRGLLFDVSLDLSRKTGERQLVVERVEIDAGEDGRVLVTGLVDGALWDSWSMAAMSIGSLRLKSLIVTADLTPDFWDELMGVGWSAPLTALASAFAAMDADSGNAVALRDLAAALPDPSGTLTALYRSTSGLGVLQISAAMMAHSRDGLDAALPLALANAELELRWNAE